MQSQEAVPSQDEGAELKSPDIPVAGDHHLVRDMDARQLIVSAERSLIAAPLTDAVRSPSGRPSIGLIASLFDMAASNPVMIACAPDWTTTQNMFVHSGAVITDGPVVVDARLVRAGKKVSVVTADFYDGHGQLDLPELAKLIETGAADRGDGLTWAGRGLTTFMRLPRSAASGQDDYNPARWIGQVQHTPLDAPVDGSMYERMGLTPVDRAGGILELERTSYVMNSIGTIMGGAQAVFIEAAAEAMGPGQTATDLEIHFLSQLKVGPARTTGRLIRAGAGHSVVEIAVVDAGYADQVLTLATVTLT